MLLQNMCAHLGPSHPGVAPTCHQVVLPPASGHWPDLGSYPLSQFTPYGSPPPVSKAELLADVPFMCTCLTGDNEAGSNTRRAKRKKNHFLPSSKSSIKNEKECDSAFGPSVANLDGSLTHMAPKMTIKLHGTLHHHT